ncbi:Uncharacterised protein [Serratia fonticola]|uniref:Uncharacterized protein n=1 Tax=Serratia fonticola TaxID=47917 RepID=A0A4V6KTD9_SERFO|nr:Uncharacterised protein [Serratia fonticola]
MSMVLTDFFVNLTMDMAKLAVSVGIAWGSKNDSYQSYDYWEASVIAIAGGIFLLGLGISYGLYRLDSELKISERIIKHLKSYKEHNAPYHPRFNFLTLGGRYSRG